LAGAPVTGVTDVPAGGGAVALLVGACAVLGVCQVLDLVAIRLHRGEISDGLTGRVLVAVSLLLELGLTLLLVLAAKRSPLAVVAGLLVAAAGTWAITHSVALWDALMIDELTGLGTRRRLCERSIFMLTAASQARPLWLALADLDDFKSVNDRLGHAAGDHVLAVVGERLRAAVPEPMTAVRLGGDEFALLLPGLSAHDAETLLKGLVTVVGESIDCGAGRGAHVGMSFGLAVAPHDADTLSGLLKTADERLYAAKAARPRDARSGSVTA